MVIASVSMSATICVISTPRSPKIAGSMSIAGMKKIPFLAEEVTEALKPRPIDCSIILVMILKALIGSTAT